MVSEEFCKIVTKDPAALIPGSAAYRWLKLDKSRLLINEKPLIRKLYIAGGYVTYPLRDAALVGVYYAIGSGLVKLVEETIKLIK